MGGARLRDVPAPDGDARSVERRQALRVRPVAVLEDVPPRLLPPALRLGGRGRRVARGRWVGDAVTGHVCLVKNEKCGTDAIEEHTGPFEEYVPGDMETKCRC